MAPASDATRQLATRQAQDYERNRHVFVAQAVGSASIVTTLGPWRSPRHSLAAEGTLRLYRRYEHSRNEQRTGTL